MGAREPAKASNPESGSQSSRLGVGSLGLIWEFPKIRGALSWGPYNKDPTF